MAEMCHCKGWAGDRHSLTRGEHHHEPANRRTVLALSIVSLLGFAFAMPGVSLAQQKQQVSFKSPAANTKYTQQAAVDVGDVPGHQLRVFELHRTYSGGAPVIAGLKLTDQWTRGITDFTDGTGSSTTYSVFVMEIGDKFFSRAHSDDRDHLFRRIATTCSDRSRPVLRRRQVHFLISVFTAVVKHGEGRPRSQQEGPARAAECPHG
jgi:hypothetical protein